MSDELDIVEQLESMAAGWMLAGLPDAELPKEAAAEITRLRAELAEAQQLARDQFDLRAEQRDERDRLHALSAQPAAVPGWQWVPVEPTPEMEHAWMGAVAGPNERPIAAGYRAMLAAAPQAPQQNEAQYAANSETQGTAS